MYRIRKQFTCYLFIRFANLTRTIRIKGKQLYFHSKFWRAGALNGHLKTWSTLHTSGKSLLKCARVSRSNQMLTRNLGFLTFDLCFSSHLCRKTYLHFCSVELNYSINRFNLFSKLFLFTYYIHSLIRLLWI